MKYFLFPFLLFIGMSCFSQVQTISGMLYDDTSKEPLINATIYEHNNRKGTYSNEYGFYSFTLPEGKINLEFTYVGYQKKVISFNLKSDTSIDVSLIPGAQISQVIITKDNSISQLYSIQSNFIHLQSEQVKKMPVLLGESDLLKTIQFLPGVQGGNEGFSGMHVRGGTNDQNLILLDGVPVYNVNHFFGLFSVFHPAAIKSVKLYKGGFPARYQGRVSSVLDIRMKEGNLKEFKGEGSIGLISSKFSFEGPIIKDTSSFILSARRTYLDLLTRPITSLSAANGTIGYYFQDINAKVNYRFSDKSRLYLSSYLGKDDFYHNMEENYSGADQSYNYNKESGLEWGNQTGVLRWNYIFHPKLFSNFTFSYSNFRFLISDQMEEKTSHNELHQNYKYNSGIRNLKGGVTFDYLPAPNHFIRFGATVGYSSFNPGVTIASYDEYKNNSVQTNFWGNDRLYSKKYEAYIEDEWTISKRLATNVGLNLNGYLHEGTNYLNLEPRISLRYLANQTISVKASGGIMNQYLHLLTNSTIGLPTDLWVPSTKMIKPVHSYQYTLGISTHFEPSLSLAVETFYKAMKGLTEYKEGVSFLSDGTWEEKITQGNGYSCGGELFLKKTKGKTTGWISYTLTWANRNFEKLNFGQTYPFKYDRRHVFNISLNHIFNDNLSINGSWMYMTGRTATIPTHQLITRSFYESHTAYYYKNRNNLRFPSSHRLDIGVNLNKKKDWGERTWRFGLYNAYSHINPFYLYYHEERKSFVKVGILPALPFVCYNFKF